MRQVVNPPPRTSQGELVAKTETLLIFRFSKRKFVGRNILGRWTILETVAHTLNKTPPISQTFKSKSYINIQFEWESKAIQGSSGRNILPIPHALVPVPLSGYSEWTTSAGTMEAIIAQVRSLLGSSLFIIMILHQLQAHLTKYGLNLSI